MTISVTVTVTSREEASQAAVFFASMTSHLPWEVKKDPAQTLLGGTGADVQTYEFEGNVSDGISTLEPKTQAVHAELSTITTLTTEQARDAEHALIAETVAAKKRGRPAKVKSTEEPITQPTIQITQVTSGDDELLALLSEGTVSHTAVAFPVEEAQVEEATADTTVDDDIEALLGGPPVVVEEATLAASADRYMSMDHDALYAELKKRCGADILAPRLSERIREATSRDKKMDSAYKFTDAMLAEILREADTGKFSK